mmetsp:Transcript_51308/g.111581  ORF Transcript_51308/g.111581 Transcript_51308/m.111581 type:complete len:388 (+) Transcript_51308:1032-2195(+)
MRRRGTRLVRRDLPDSLSAAEGRHGRHPRVCGGRHGELGFSHLPRGRSADRRQERLVAPAPTCRGGRDPRARPPVVRQSGDHGVVGRLVAQRGLCHLDGDGSLPQAAPWLEHVGAIHHRHAGPRAEPRRAPIVASDPGSDRQGRGGRTGLRRHLLLQGRIGCSDGARDSRRGQIRRRAPQLHVELLVRQRDDRRPVGRVGGRLRKANQEADGSVDSADGISTSRAQGGRAAAGRIHQAQPPPVLVPLGRQRALVESVVDDPSLRHRVGRRQRRGEDGRGAADARRGRLRAQRQGRRRVVQAQRWAARSDARRLPGDHGPEPRFRSSHQEHLRRRPHRSALRLCGAREGGARRSRQLPRASGRLLGRDRRDRVEHGARAAGRATRHTQ